MPIDASVGPNIGYNGADYDFYVESAGGKLSGSTTTPILLKALAKGGI
jgi:hypothetical protein